MKRSPEFPSLEMNDAGNIIRGHVKPLSKIVSANTRIKRADFLNFFPRQFGIGICKSSSGSMSAPSLAYHVGHIVGGRSKEKVVRIKATPHVAFVANKKTVRDRSLVQYPRQSVGGNMSTAYFSGCDFTIPTSCKATCPKPTTAIVRNDDYITPKTLLDCGSAMQCGKDRIRVKWDTGSSRSRWPTSLALWLRKTIIILHDEILSFCRTLVALTTQGHFLIFPRSQRGVN